MFCLHANISCSEKLFFLYNLRFETYNPGPAPTSIPPFPLILLYYTLTISPKKILHLQLGRQGNYENCGRLLFIPILSLLSFILPLYSSFFFGGGVKLYRNKTRLSVLFPYLSLFTLNFLFFVCIAHSEWSIQT